jgi:hypothetical protein
MVYGDPANFLDRQIMNLEPKSKFSHGGFILYHDDKEPEFVDVHFRFFISSLRRFPAVNYEWPYSLNRIKNLNQESIEKIVKWIDHHSRLNIHYDFLQGLWQIISNYLNLSKDRNPWDNKKAFHSAEFLICGLEAGGFNIPHPEGFELYSYIEQAGILEEESPWVRRRLLLE